MNTIPKELHERTIVDVLVNNMDNIRYPLCIYYEDGRKFYIDRVLDIKLIQPSHCLNGCCRYTRYTISVRGNTEYLFYDDYSKEWFVNNN